MEDVSENFEKLTNSEFMTEVAVVFGTYLGTEVAQPVVDGVSPVDLPNEAYGAGVVVGAEMGGVPYKRSVQLGGGVYLVDQLAQRLGVKSRIQGVLN